MPDFSESSKQGYKTSKRTKNALVVAATREENEGISILGGGSKSTPVIQPNNAQNDLQHDAEELTNSVTTTEKVKNGSRAKLTYLNKGKFVKVQRSYRRSLGPQLGNLYQSQRKIGKISMKIFVMTYGSVCM
ncbi:uncharacterized protein Fot_02575 [Forsythia ovata]|uniref:Uncharacterized protein n=1 Tax=Forsythia ovata TaxID=205694 RepID=A0ABD1X784_9LAMI